VGFIGLTEPAWMPDVRPAIEVGWRLAHEHWGKGLATEGGEAALRFGFETLGLDRIISLYEPENVASGRVMAKIGMCFQRDTHHPTLPLPVRIFEITADQWRTAPT
ncbi:MAG TPA: GNAT family N-acetyltransferase, partial [Acidimicrobiales bacterium]|nr:GNAT family N-acetyltransferase [Acidimicrobiales bacterium]